MLLLEETRTMLYVLSFFCYVIMFVSKLTLTTNIRALLFISKAFCLNTVITEQACIHNHTEHRGKSEKQPQGGL